MAQTPTLTQPVEKEQSWEKPKPKENAREKGKPGPPSPKATGAKPDRGRAWNHYTDPPEERPWNQFTDPAERVTVCAMCGSREGVELDTGWRCTRCGAYYPDPSGRTL